MKLFKILLKIAAILGSIYAALFAVFYFDLDGKLLYYIVEPLMVKRFDKMPRKDVVSQTPYGATVEKAEKAE